MRYLPLTDPEREEIKKTIGISDVKELFSCIPSGKCFPSLAGLPPALSEPELIAAFREMGLKNRFAGHLSFLGAGACAHFIPEVVSYLSSRGEFLTPYTPYQPEVSQGSLQAIFEYQTMMTMLTGLDVANASLYDGATAAAEAVLAGRAQIGAKPRAAGRQPPSRIRRGHPHLRAEPAHRIAYRGHPGKRRPGRCR